MNENEQQANGPAPNEHGPDLAGYPSVDELARGYRQSAQEAKRLKERADALERQFMEFQQRQQVPQRQRPEDRLSELGIPVDAIDEIVNQRLSQALAPLSRMAEARSQILARYPDYTKHESEVMQFIGGDPERLERYNRIAAADPAGALEYSILAYGAERQKAQPRGEPNPETVHAQIPGQRSADASRARPGYGQSRDEAWERYQQNPSRENASSLAGTVIRSDPAFQKLVSGE